MLTCGCAPTWHQLTQGADAAEWLLADIFGVHLGARRALLRKAASNPNPLTKPGFISIVREIAGSLYKVAAPVEQVALARAMHMLDRDWYRLNGAQQEVAIQRAMGVIAGVDTIVAPRVRGVLEAAGKDVVLGTKSHAAKAWDLDITPSFEGVDKTVVDHIAASQAFYIRNQYGKREVALSAVARQVVADGVEAGLDRYAIARNMSAALAGTTAERSERYYAMVASVFAARARSYATLSGFDEAGIETAEWNCSLDEVSCHPCRFMHGRVFSTSVGLGGFAKIAESSDPETVVEAQPFMGTMRRDDGGLALYYKAGGERHTVAHVEDSALGQKDEQGKFSRAMSRKGLEDAGLTTPPIHPSCRCLLIPMGTSAQVPEDIGPRAVAPGAPAHPPHQAAEEPPPPPASGPRLIESPPVESPPAKLPDNLHELVRPAPAAARIENPEVTPAGTPEEDAAAAAKLKAKAIVDAALAKLAAMPKAQAPGFVEHGLAHQPPDADGDYITPFTTGKGGELTKVKLAGAAKQKPKDVPVTSITLLSPITREANVKAAILAPDQPVAILVKKGGTLYPASVRDQAIVVAGNLRGEGSVPVKVVDLDKAAKKKPPAAPPAVPQPPAGLPSVAPAPVPTIALSPSSPMGSAANILHHKDGGAKGSNDGGFYTGADGVKRYVKFYDDAAQSHCEHLANTIYTDLGHAAPSSTLFEHNGKVAYASDLFHGGKTLKEIGGPNAITQGDAKAILKGFVADVLTGNWDAVGTGFDNVMRLSDGRWVRIDNGGTFLMRAKAGRKPESALNSITEWEVFFSSKNPYYSELANKAGVSSPEDMKGVVVDELRKALALRDAAGGWGTYVANHIPGCPPHDRARVVDMLTERSKLLEEKLAELTAPAKPQPAPGVARYVAKQYSTVLPKPGQRIEDLPETRVIEDHYKKIDRHNPDKLPSGEKYADYKKRIERSIGGISSDARSAITSFTGSGYTSIRDSEDRGAPDGRSKSIQKAYGVAKPEPGTVFRAIANLPRATIEKYVSNAVFQLGKVGGATSSSSWLIDVSIDGFMGGNANDHHRADQYKILFVLNGRSQIPVETISGTSAGERELLFKRDAKFRVTGLSRAKGTKRVLIVEGEELVDVAGIGGHKAFGMEPPP